MEKLKKIAFSVYFSVYRCVLLSFQLKWKLSLLIKCMKASLRPIYEKKNPPFFLDDFLSSFFCCRREISIAPTNKTENCVLLLNAK